jgi:hypothetical protein
MNWFVLVGVIIMALSLGVSFFQHELVHVNNAEKEGIDSYITFLPDKLAIATVRIETGTKVLSKEGVLANSINEAVAYNLTPLFVGIMGVMFLGFFYIGKVVGDKE